ncbi:MAG: hypothetical protein Q7T97_03120 [Burkholderiaceae bacterium]|nr:hypothetical protein [Burkholderiaceae bacterium]
MRVLRSMVFATASATLTASSLAAPILIGTTTNPVGFSGLMVGGTSYNVSFTTQSYDITFASIPPTFLGNEELGLQAAFALVEALSSTGVTTLGDFVAPPIEFPVFRYNVYVPTQLFFGNSTSVYIASKPRNRVWESAYGGGPISDRPLGLFGQRYDVYAVFSVPESSTASLALAGILAALCARRKRQCDA